MGSTVHMGIRTVCFHLNHFTQHNAIMLNWFKKIINKYCLCHRIKMPPIIPVRNIVFLPKMRAAIDHNVAVNFRLITAQSRNYTVPSLVPFPMSSVSWHGVCKNTSVAHQEKQLSLNWKCGEKNNWITTDQPHCHLLHSALLQGQRIPLPSIQK